MAAFAFAVVQAVGQLTFIRTYVEDYSSLWFATSTLQLVAGAMILVYVRFNRTHPFFIVCR